MVHSVPPERRLSLLYCGMPAILARTVRELITDPKPDTTYTSLKVELLRRGMESAENRVRILMEDDHLDDRNPSQFLLRLRELNNSPSDDSPLLKICFFFTFAAKRSDHCGHWYSDSFQ